MDFSKLGQGHRIAAGAGALLFIDLFLTWYSLNLSGAQDAQADSLGLDTGFSAWQAFDFNDILLAAVAIVAIGAAVQSAGLLTLPVRLSSILAPGAGLLLIWMLYRLINQPGPNNQVNNDFGAYIGFVLLALVAWGAFQAQNEPESVGPAAASSTPPPSAPPPAPPAPPAV
jgi:hypothetical protein